MVKTVKKLEIVERDGVKWYARKKFGRPRESGENYVLVRKVEEDGSQGDSEPVEATPVKPKKKSDGISRYSWGHVYEETDHRILLHCPECDKRNRRDRAMVGECAHCKFSVKGMAAEELKAL